MRFCLETSPPPACISRAVCWCFVSLFWSRTAAWSEGVCARGTRPRCEQGDACNQSQRHAMASSGQACVSACLSLPPSLALCMYVCVMYR